MKQSATIFLSVLLSCCALFAQQQEATTITEDGVIVTRKVVEGIASTKAGIVVTDINFGSRPVGLSALISDAFHITNRGDAQLRITKNSGVVPSSMAAVFDISDVKAAKYPLIIDSLNSGFNSQTFHVKFTPNAVGTFNATITFSSNATGIDSVCHLHGIGVHPGITVNALEFGRRRIGGSFDSDVEGGPSQIMIDNSLGNVVSTINSIKISGATSEFVVDDGNNLKDLIGKGMNPAEQIIRSIKFNPKKTGYDTLIITFGVTTDSPITFIATGVGVTPKLQLPNIDFGRVDIKSTSPQVSKTFHIVNLDVTTTPTWEWYDDALFDDVGSALAGQIGGGGQTDVGSKGFSYSLKQFDLPFALAAGATSWDFSAWYKPSKVGHDSATFYYNMRSATDVPDSMVTYWTGEGYEGANAVLEEASGLDLYPSPVQNTLHLQFDSEAKRSYSIVDALARTVMQQNSENGNADVLDVSSLSSGMYTIYINESGKTSIKRFIKL